MSDLDWIGRPLDRLLGYQPGMKMPVVHHHDNIPWNPIYHTTPRRVTEDAHVFWRTKLTIGVKWKNLRLRCLKTAVNDARMLTARRIVKRLIDTWEIIMPDTMSASDAARAEEALAYTVAVVQDPQQDTKYRLAAAKTLLDFTRTKPATRSDLTIKGAEDWLRELAGE